MDELEKFLVSINLNLDDEAEQDENGTEGPVTTPSGNYRRESVVERESRTESILRQDMLVPHVVHFTSSAYQSKRKFRRVMAGILVVSLSIMGLFHFSTIVLSLAHEDTLDIDSKMKAAGGDVNATMQTTNSSSDDVRAKI